MLDTAFHDENNRSLGLGDTGGVVTPNFVFFFLQEVEIEQIVTEDWHLLTLFSQPFTT